MISNKAKAIIYIILFVIFTIACVINGAYPVAGLFAAMTGYYVWYIASGRASPYKNPIVTAIKDKQEEVEQEKEDSKNAYEKYMRDIDERFDTTELDEAIREEYEEGEEVDED